MRGAVDRPGGSGLGGSPAAGANGTPIFSIARRAKPNVSPSTPASATHPRPSAATGAEADLAPFPVKIHHFATELWLASAPEAVFDFFAAAENLDSITPAWLNFHTETPLPIEMRTGTLIDYRLRIRGWPVRWRTLISAWEPPHRFVDEQVRGPYRLWIHEHRFEAHQGGTLVLDSVTYATPLDWLVHKTWVRPDIEKIFGHRSDVLKRRFAHAVVTSPGRVG